jgi:hypothetical protein
MPTMRARVRADSTAHESADRLVTEGVLGCANCRDGFPIQAGFGDLRAPPRRELEVGLAGAFGSRDELEAERIAARIGVVCGPGTVVLVGGLARCGPVISLLTQDLQIVGIDTRTQAPGRQIRLGSVSSPVRVCSRILRGAGPTRRPASSHRCPGSW